MKNNRVHAGGDQILHSSLPACRTSMDAVSAVPSTPPTRPPNPGATSTSGQKLANLSHEQKRKLLMVLSLAKGKGKGKQQRSDLVPAKASLAVKQEAESQASTVVYPCNGHDASIIPDNQLGLERGISCTADSPATTHAYGSIPLQDTQIDEDDVLTQA